MRIPVQRLCGAASESLRLEIIDLDRIHAAILEQLEQIACVAARLKRHIGRPLQDVYIRRAVVAVVGKRERGRVRCGQPYRTQREQTEGRVPPQPTHRPTSLSVHNDSYYLFRSI